MSVLPRFTSSALQLAGGAYLDVGNPAVLSGLQSYTLEAWVYLGSTAGSQSVVGKMNVGVDAEYQLYLDNGVPTVAYPGTSGLSAPSALATDQWHYLAASYDAIQGVLTLYVDFAQVTQGNFTPSSSTSAADVLIGAIMVNGTPGWFLQGNIGRVLVWSSCRTAEEILNDSVQLDVNDAVAEPTLELYLDFSIIPAVDMSGNNISLTFEGGAQYLLSTPGLQLAGSAYVACGDNPTLDLSGNKPYTIEGWISPTAAGVVVSKYQGQAQSQYQVSYEASNQVVAFRNSDALQIASQGAVTPGAFYHVAMSYDDVNNLLSLYVNGNLQAAQIFPSAVPSEPNVQLLVGANQDSGGTAGNFFQGQIQNLRIWNVCLDQADIQQWMYNQPVDDPTLLADLDFSVSPPIDTTQQNFLQLEGGATVGVTTATVDPTSFEGTIGNIQAVNADYFNQTPDPALPPPVTNLFIADQPEPLSDAHREASWEALVAGLAYEDAATRADLRRRFEEGWNEARARVAANPSLLDVFSEVEENGELRVIYHGPRGDSVILAVPAGSIDPCTLWWIQFIYMLTIGFLQALGLAPSNASIATRVYNLVSQNPAVVRAMQTLVGQAITASSALGLVGVIYQQGLFWPILKFALTAAGWWALVRILAQIIAVVTGAEAAVILAGFIAWAAQLTILSLKFSGSCGSSASDLLPSRVPVGA